MKVDWRLVGLGCLFVAVGFNAYLLFPELVGRAPPLNDHVFHLMNLERAADAVAAGRDPTDVWQPWVGQGFPVFHYYQHLPYLVPAVVAEVTGFDLDQVFKVTHYVLLGAFPIAIFWSVRRFGFGVLTAGTSALIASTLATDALFGFDFASYVWAGHGLYTQLWGMAFLPLALGQSYRALVEGRGYVWAVVLLSATALSHLAYGYIALGSLVLICVLVPQRDELLRRARRLGIILAFFALTTSYFLVPLVLDRAYLNRSVWESAFKYDSFGAPTILGWLFSGELLDFGRLPTITFLAGVGLILCLSRWRSPRYRVPAGLFVLWLLLYFGRPVWGFLLDFTPLSRDFFLHRLIGGVHLGAILLAGIGLAMPLAWAARRAKPGYLVAAGAVAVLLLFPVFKDRVDYMHFSDALMDRTEAALASERTDVDDLLARLDGLPAGRVYAGLAGQWGKDYRVGDAPMYAMLARHGYDTLHLFHSWSVAGDVAALFDEQRPDEYALFNIRYVVAPEDRQFPDFVRPIGAFGRHRLYEVATGGWFALVNSPIGFVGDKSTFYLAASAWLSSAQVAAGEHPSVYFGDVPDDAGSVLPIASAPAYFADTGLNPPASPGLITAETVNVDRYSAIAEVSDASLAMLKVTYHPDWHALVDGEEVQARMLMPGYIGVPVEPGRHSIEFEYRAPVYRYVLLVIGLLSLVLLAIADARRREVGRLVASAGQSLTLARVSAPVMRLLRSGNPPERTRKPGGLLQRAIGWLSESPLRALALILLIGVAIRLLLLPQYAYLPAEALDEYAWSRWMHAINDHGVLNVFRETQTDYVAYHWVLWVLSALYDGLGGVYIEYLPQAGQYAAFPFGLHLLMKLPPLLFDVLLIVTGYVATLALFRPPHIQAGWPSDRGQRLGLAAAAILAIHPAVVYDSAVWAQIDGVGALAMLGSVVLIGIGRHGWGWGIWTLGFLIKPQSFVILPILVLLTLRRGGLRSLASGAGTVGVVAVVVLGPWIIHGDLPRIVDIFASNFGGGLYSGSLSLAAWNTWWFGTPGSPPGAADAGFSWLPFLTPRGIGLGLAAMAAGVALLYTLARPGVLAALIGSAYLAFALFMLPTGVHERYLYPFVVLLLPVVLIDRRWLWLYVGVSATFILNQVVVGPPIHDFSGRWHESALSFVVAGCNVLLFLAFTYVLLQGIGAWAGQLAAARQGSVPGLIDVARRLAGRAAPDTEAPQSPADDVPLYDEAGPAVASAVTSRSLIWDLASLAGVLSAAVLAGLPLIGGRWMSGHDSLVYVPRNVEFYEVLRGGTWFPRWAPDLGFGHGEPTFNFNPPLINYLTSLFHPLGLNFVAAEDAAILFLLILAGVGMYFLAREFFGRTGGLVSAVAYLFAPYLLSRLYVSHALADYAAFAFLPFAFWGVHRYADEGRYRFLVLGAIASALILLSSSPAALMTFPALTLVVVWLWRARRQLGVLVRGAWCLLLGLGLATFFWLPSLAESSFVHIARREERLPYGDHFVSPLQLIHSPWGFGTSQAGTADGMSFAIGPLYLLGALAALLLLPRIRAISVKSATAVQLFLVIGVGAAFMTTGLSKPIWDVISALHPLQFPFRFLQLVALSTALLLGSVVMPVFGRPRIAMGVSAGLIGALIVLGLPQAKPLTYLDLSDADFSPQNIAARGIAASAREFEPIWVDAFPATPAVEPELTFVGGSGRVTDSVGKPLRQLFAVDVSQDSLVKSSTFYFPGWSLYVDGVKRAVAPGSPDGLMEFYLEPGRHAVLLQFEDTPIRTASSIISVGALALLLGSLLFRGNRRRNAAADGGIP